MKRFIKFALFTFALLLTGAGCSGNPNVMVNPTPTAPEKIIFSPPEALTASEGVFYSYSFCEPDSARSGATCGGLAGTTQNPARGNPPYSFSPQINSGAFPPGLALELNGLLKGTPTLAGQYAFGVCAKDAADEACVPVTLTVKPATPPPPPPPLAKSSLTIVTSGTGKGTVKASPSVSSMTYDPSATVKLTAVASADSIFDHWEGDCNGSKLTCSLLMSSNKTVTAVFKLAPVVPTVTSDIKIGSFICAWTVGKDAGGYEADSIRITSTGTARGPVGARVELPILSWSDDTFDCGAWTYHSGALIAVGGTCTRKEGQPETTDWTVDTGSPKIIPKYGWNNNRTYTAKVYLDDDLTPQNTDSKTTVCQ